MLCGYLFVSSDLFSISAKFLGQSLMQLIADCIDDKRSRIDFVPIELCTVVYYPMR